MAKFIFSILLVLMLAAPASANHALALIPHTGGIPQIDATATPYAGSLFIGEKAGYGAFLISGTLAQLQALAALPNVYGICLLTTTTTAKWAEMDNAILPALRTKLNVLLTSKGITNIPVGMTNRTIVGILIKQFNVNVDMKNEWVSDQ